MTDVSFRSARPPKEDLEQLVQKHMIAAFAAGMIPLPIADLVTMTAVQLNLVRKIAARFQVPFSRNAVKSIIGALAGGAVPVYSAPPVASMIKTIPVVGGIVGFVTMPTISAAMTYAVGNIFIQHFESGGTLLTFDASKASELFKSLFQKGQKEAAAMSRTDEEATDISENDNETASSDGSKEVQEVVAAKPASREKETKKPETENGEPPSAKSKTTRNKSK